MALQYLYQRISTMALPKGFLLVDNKEVVECKRCGWRARATLKPKHIQFMHKIERPHCKSDYTFFSRREMLDSFDSWPLGPLPDVDDLVKRGFYYTGMGDVIRCIYCGFHFGESAKEDHYRHNPTCLSFLIK